MNSKNSCIWVLALVLLGCSSSSADRDPAVEKTNEERSVEGVLTGDLPAGAKMLYSTQQDRAFIISEAAERYLVWQHKQASWKELWRSRNLYGAVPHVEIGDFNGDGSNDLFWAFDYEGLIGGMAVLHVAGRTVELAPSVEECKMPTITQTARGYIIVAHEPGAYSPEDCAEPVVRVCVDALQMTWPRFFRISGSALEEARESEDFYRDLAGKYQQAAATLDSLIATGSKLPNTDMSAEYCGRDIPSSLRALADSALALSR